ncbi:serine hydrolase-like protein isoform X2 [Dicentrarchus labrax]|uniref:serine hydrolase-like protein isoform X2 n=1 Tax=Dicentrarchus labrax TaxID=13489 RepID=UPI0021F55AC7|nr:serine hydrolase-like protein isoform X2 [Dicentrarchus labrax]
MVAGNLQVAFMFQRSEVVFSTFCILFLLIFIFAVSELSVRVPWGEIRGKVWGPDHGRPVLCLHGWADNCGTFKTLIPLLPKDCRYVAVDLAGHGLSSHRPPGVFYSFPAYVADVRRIVDGLQWTKFSIIGHSMGANIAALVTKINHMQLITVFTEYTENILLYFLALYYILSILCFPQFSSLYPDMVEAVILLDAFGFLPTDPKEIPKVMRQGMEEMLQYEKKTEEKKRVYTFEKAAERLLAANPTLSEESVHILLERGFVFSRDLRLNFKNIVRISLEQSLEMQSRIQAPVLVVLADKGFGAKLPESNRQILTSTLLQGYRDRNHMVVTVPGDHHVHLNNPEVVAPLVSDFLQTKVISHQLPA